MTPEEFSEWKTNAKIGERLVYHVGLLMADRQSPPDGESLGVLAGEISTAANRGHIVLLQERVEPLVCRYYAVRI